MAIVEIHDDFDIEKIRLSGQCFRIKKMKSHNNNFCYLINASNRELKLKEVSDHVFDVSCTKAEFSKIWHSYFDLDKNYEEIRLRNQGTNKVVDEALSFGRGLRILKQDAWEMMITFIISQRRNMASIANCVEKLCVNYGERIDESYAFPSAKTICDLSISDIQACGVGYRAEFILDAAKRVMTGELNLPKCENMTDEELFLELCKIKGVGKKVANCIMLFGFGRYKRAPVDVWIQRIIDEDFAGINPFPTFGEDAGIIQQYLFFWKTQNKKV